MPRRLLRFDFNGLCLLSLLACVGTCVLWWRSYRGHNDTLNVRLRGTRYVLRSEAGRVTAWGLRKGGDPARVEAIGRCIAGHRDSTLLWWVHAHHGDEVPRSIQNLLIPQVEGIRALDGMKLSFGRGDAEPLYQALSDPDRFAVAHAALLLFVFQRIPDFDLPAGFKSGENVVTLDPRLRRIEGVWYGLRVRFPEEGEGWRGWPHLVDPFKLDARGGLISYKGVAAGYDPAQIPALRDMWFGRLAEPQKSLPLWQPTIVSALPPLLWLALRSRRFVLLRRRGGLGLCRRCGYDLTGNLSGRCSECGEPVNRKAAA